MPCAPLVVADTWTPSRSRTGPTRTAVRLESVQPDALVALRLDLFTGFR
jgi:hypothetical protein